MGRRARNDLDDLFEAWARWAASGRWSAGGRSLLARWMDGCGHVVFGGAGADMVSASAFPLEERVEAVVLALSRDDLLAADVLRLEYRAGEGGVIRRRRIRGYDPRFLGQAAKAAALGISVRTYRRRLAAARSAVEAGLADAARWRN